MALTHTNILSRKYGFATGSNKVASTYSQFCCGHTWSRLVCPKRQSVNRDIDATLTKAQPLELKEKMRRGSFYTSERTQGLSAHHSIVQSQRKHI